jgi:hypothetical protein
MMVTLPSWGKQRTYYLLSFHASFLTYCSLKSNGTNSRQSRPGIFRYYSLLCAVEHNTPSSQSVLCTIEPTVFISTRLAIFVTDISRLGEPSGASKWTIEPSIFISTRLATFVPDISRLGEPSSARNGQFPNNYTATSAKLWTDTKSRVTSSKVIV